MTSKPLLIKTTVSFPIFFSWFDLGVELKVRTNSGITNYLSASFSNMKIYIRNKVSFIIPPLTTHTHKRLYTYTIRKGFKNKYQNGKYLCFKLLRRLAYWQKETKTETQQLQINFVAFFPSLVCTLNVCVGGSFVQALTIRKMWKAEGSSWKVNDSLIAVVSQVLAH